MLPAYMLSPENVVPRIDGALAVEKGWVKLDSDVLEVGGLPSWSPSLVKHASTSFHPRPKRSVNLVRSNGLEATCKRDALSRRSSYTVTYFSKLEGLVLAEIGGNPTLQALECFCEVEVLPPRPKDIARSDQDMWRQMASAFSEGRLLASAPLTEGAEGKGTQPADEWLRSASTDALFERSHQLESHSRARVLTEAEEALALAIDKELDRREFDEPQSRAALDSIDRDIQRLESLAELRKMLTALGV